MSKLRFVVSLITKENDYQLEQAAAAQAVARKLGVDVQILYAEDDAVTQSTQLLKIVQGDPAARPHAIVFEPVGGTAFPQAAQAAVNANIGWAVLNREADYIPQLRKGSRIPIFSISSDHKEIGRIQGRQLAVLLPDGGAVLYIQGPSENSAARERTTGMQMTVPPGVQITSLRGRWTEESAQRAVESWLRLNTSNKVQIDVLAAQNDAMAVGARKAFEEITDLAEREKWIRIPYIGVDGLPKTGQTWVRIGSLTATVIVPTNTGQAISMLVEALQTKTNPPERSLTVPESFPPFEKLCLKRGKIIPTVPTV